MLIIVAVLSGQAIVAYLTVPTNKGCLKRAWNRGADYNSY